MVLIAKPVLAQLDACIADFDPDTVVEFYEAGDYTIYYVLHDGALSCACPGREAGGLNVFYSFNQVPNVGEVFEYQLQIPILYDLVTSNVYLDPPTTIQGPNTVSPFDDYNLYEGTFVGDGQTRPCLRSVIKYTEAACDSLSGIFISPNVFDRVITREFIGGNWVDLSSFQTTDYHQLVNPVGDGTLATVDHSSVLSGGSPQYIPFVTANTTFNLDLGVNLIGNNYSNPSATDSRLTMYCDANAKVLVPTFLTMDYAQVRHCEEQWQGVELVQGGDVDMTDQSIIKGATRGIEVNGNSFNDISIANSSIIDCQTGIRAARTASGQSFSAILNEANIAIQDGVPPPSVTAPAVFASFTGIEVVAYDDLDLESSVSSTSISNYDRGIRFVSANGNIGNFLVANCNIGVQTAGGVTDELKIINNAISNTEIGIDISNTGTRVLKNTITNSLEGVKADMTSNGLFEAKDNNITVLTRGILLKDLKEESINNRITDNMITITGSTGEGSFGGVGIEHNNADGLVRGNNITLLGNQVGVYSINGTDPLIQRNTVFIQDPAADATGIRAENTTNGYYHENEVYGTFGEEFTQSTGMYFSGSPNSIVQCNVLKEVEIGFHAVGSNQNMTKEGTFHTINRIATQLDINGAGQGAIIGDQGQVGDHHGNQWPTNASFIDAAHYSTDQFVVQQSQFFADKNNSTLWPSVIFTVDPQAVWFIPDVPVTTYDDCDNYPSNDAGGGMSQDFETSSFMMSGMASSGLSTETQTSWLVQTYEMVSHHITEREYTTEELAFLQAYDDTDIAAIANAHYILKTQGGDGAAAAGGLLGSIDSEDTVLSTMQEAMQLWAAHLQDLELTDGDMMTLEYIADLCTQEYGAAVAVARGLLTIDSPRIWDDAMACQQVEERSYGSNEPDGLRIYPNPTTGVVQLGLQDIDRLEVMTLDGRIQLTSRSSDAIDLGDLPSAIYLVKAYSADDKVIGIDKVIKLQ